MKLLLYLTGGILLVALVFLFIGALGLAGSAEYTKMANKLVEILKATR